jgi:cephalosporin-C deacetylase
MRAVVAAVLLLAVSARAAITRPREFDQFWDSTKRHLGVAELNPVLTPDPDNSDLVATCFKVSYASLRGVVIHGRYCRPAPEGVYPAVLVSPWYAQGAVPPPRDLVKEGFAALSYQARGFDVDLPAYPSENSYYVLNGLDEPETYVYRDIVAHALRGLDFLASRPEVDAKRLGVMGASQGGGVSLMVAGLDKRVAAVAADFPFLSDWPDSLSAPHSPYSDVREFLAQRANVPQNAKLMKTLSFFDTANVAENIAVPVLVQAGLKDQTCPAAGIKKMFGMIKSSSKTLKEYPKADHTDEGPERWQTSIDFLAKTLSGR